MNNRYKGDKPATKMRKKFFWRIVRINTANLQGKHYVDT